MSQDLQDRIQRSFDAQGLMATLGAQLQHVQAGDWPEAHDLKIGAVTSIVDSACGYAALTQAPAGMEVVTAEFKINLMRPGIGERFLAIGKVQNAGRLLTVCTGEVRAYAGGADEAFKVIALMQATIVNVPA